MVLDFFFGGGEQGQQSTNCSALPSFPVATFLVTAKDKEQLYYGSHVQKWSSTFLNIQNTLNPVTTQQ